MREIIKHYEKCLEIHGNNSKGVDWPNENDANKRYSVMLQSIAWDGRQFPDERKITLLDYGCGLGHFLDLKHHRCF